MNRLEILNYLNQWAPPETAEGWDNVGLLADSGETEVTALLVALDVTPAAVEAAGQAGASLIVSHHPLIFKPLSRLDGLPYRLAAAGLSVFSAHTNLDKAPGGVNDALAAALGLVRVRTAADGLCRLGELPEAMEAAAFAEFVAARLGAPVRAAGTRPVRRVGLCGGAGWEELAAFSGEFDGCVTGEIKHHEWLEAAALGCTAVDAGHYATEVVVVDAVAARLREAFPALTVVPFRDAPPYTTRG